MTLRRTVLSFVLVGALVWCTGLVAKAYSEQQQGFDQPRPATPVAAPHGNEAGDQQLAGTQGDGSVEVLPAG